MKLVENDGARISKPPQAVFWGGFSGHFAAPDGHFWQVGYNPFVKLDTSGRMRLPPPKLGT